MPKSYTYDNDQELMPFCRLEELQRIGHQAGAQLRCRSPVLCPSQPLTCVRQIVGEYLFSGEGECAVLPCSNALAGERYTDAGSPRCATVG